MISASNDNFQLVTICSFLRINSAFLVCLLCRQTHGMHLQAVHPVWNEAEQNHSFAD